MFDQLYSQKVLEHFRNPRNMGEIKDADGVATVGNPVCGDIMRMFIKVGKKDGQEYIEDIKFQTLGCLPCGEEIVSACGGWNKIGAVKKNEGVVNSDGKETLVAETYTRAYVGPLLRIIPFVSPFNSFSVTPDHPILCIKRNVIKGARRASSKCDWLRVGEEKLLVTQPDYVKAKDLQKGDFLIFTTNQKVVDDRFFTKRFMRLLGYYISEGYVTAGDVLNFSFGDHEKELIREVEDLIFEVVGKHASSRTGNGATEIRVCSKRWADLFVKLGGKLARSKSLSLQVLLLPFHKQQEMVETWLLGDGDRCRRRPQNSETYRLITASRNLAIQIQEILARGGIFASIRQILKTNCRIGDRKLKDSVQYLISFKKQRKHKFVHGCRDRFFVPVKKIEATDFQGPVYNFQTALDPNSYLVRGFVVHNCGAAIATSSIATELIKGKTLDEAVKLTNKAVAEALDGLPRAKMHCSVLAEEAVQKAIEDYKKRNK